MSEYGDLCRDIREARRLKRNEHGVPCPVCKDKLPKANPSILLPQQRCKIHGYKDPRPRTRVDRIPTQGESTMTDKDKELLDDCNELMRLYSNAEASRQYRVADALKRRLTEPSEREKALVEQLRRMRGLKGMRVGVDEVAHIFKSDWDELMLRLAAYEKEEVK